MAVKATTVSINNLSAAVSKAVQALGDQGHSLENDFILNHIIMGRVLRENMQISQAQALAEQVAHGLTGGGQAGQAAHAAPLLSAGHAQPAVLGTHGHIIIGVILDPSISLTAHQ